MTLPLYKFIYALFIVLCMISADALNATVYYISNYGSDSNNGISPVYPIQSIKKLNSIIFMLKPGDAVLFERGSIFYGQVVINASGDDSNPITFGAYGKGKNPLISGSIPLKNWSVYKGNIYKAFVNAEIRNFFVNREQMILARYPNSGYLRIDAPYSEANKGFTDKELNQPDGYWDGSNVRIRTENWAYEHVPIQSFKKGSIIFNKPTYYTAKTGWGYYLDNNINQIDMEKEWFYDKNNKNENLYFYAPKGMDPNQQNIQGTVSDCGFFTVMEITNLVIQDLEFRNQHIAGIYLAKRKSKLRIDNCTFRGQNQLGVFIPGESDNVIINNCRFYNVNGKALYILNTKNSIISGNIFINSGMIPGYGTTGDAFPMSAVLAFGDQISISGNYINGVGHNGINCMGSSNIIEKNIVKNSLLLLNDGGAFKCYGKISADSEWKNNFIYNVPGNFESTVENDIQIIAVGFYLDELANNMKVSNNTITGCGFAGIGTNAGFNNTFEFNTCFNNSIGVSFYQNNILCRDNNFINNIVFGSKEDQIAVLNQSLYRSNVPGRFENNNYSNPSSNNIFRIRENNIISDYNFEKWKRFVKSDNNSNLLVSNELSNAKLFTNMSDDSLKILLSSGVMYSDLYKNSVYGSITLQPWSSLILIADYDISGLPEISFAGSSVKFEELNKAAQENALWFNLTGNNLTEQININAPDGFEISLSDDSDFSNSISFYPENGNAERIIFVRFDPDEDKGYYDFITLRTGNIERKLKVSANSR